MVTSQHPTLRRLAAKVDLHIPNSASGLLATRRGVVRLDAVPHLLAVDARAWTGWAARLLGREAAYADALGDAALADALYGHADAAMAALLSGRRRTGALAPGLALRQLAPFDGAEASHLPALGSHLADTPPALPRRTRAQFLIVAEEELAALVVARPLRAVGLFAPPWLRFRTADPGGIEHAGAFIARHGLRYWTSEGGPL